MAISCFNLHPLPSWKAETLYLAFHTHQYHAASDLSPVALRVSTLKFSILSFHHVPIPVNSSTQILYCCILLPWHLRVAKVPTQEAALHHTDQSLLFFPPLPLACGDFHLLCNWTAFWSRNTFYDRAEPSVIRLCARIELHVVYVIIHMHRYRHNKRYYK